MTPKVTERFQGDSLQFGGEWQHIELYTEKIRSEETKSNDTGVTGNSSGESTEAVVPSSSFSPSSVPPDEYYSLPLAVIHMNSEWKSIILIWWDRGRTKRT